MGSEQINIIKYNTMALSHVKSAKEALRRALVSFKAYSKRLLAFQAVNRLKHLVAGRNNLRIRVVCALSGDQVSQLYD